MKNIPQYILDYLQNHQRAIVPNFGVFTLKNAGAQFNNENKSILPPSQLVCFQQNFAEENENLIQYISKEKNVSAQNAKHEIQTQTDFWKKKIAAKEEFAISELGSFVLENQQMNFVGKKLPALAPDFFGLEEIVFSEIENKEKEISPNATDKNQDYKLSKSILWLFLLIIPISALAYFALTNQEFIFGKKSFNDVTIKNATHRIEDSKPTKKLQIIVDSTKMDSLKIGPQNIKK